MSSAIHEQFAITEVELIYRSKVPAKQRAQITCSNDAYQLFLQSWDENKIELLEEFKIILLNRGNYCLGIAAIGSGGYSSCVVDPKIVFSIALKSKASAMILAHNHPSGNAEPSDNDKALTKRLKDGGSLLDIKILDHVIVTPHDYYSFADAGLMP
jgi:DNA repair protein RadC